MRRNIWLTALVATLVFPAVGVSRGVARGQSQGQSNQASASQQDPIADAARRAKEQKKDQTKTAKVFTNDDLPAVGQTAPAASTSPASNGNPTGTSSSAQAATSDEQMWRDKFARLNHKRDQDQAELDVLQRELSVLNTQYYGGDPMKGLQQGLSQQDITAKKDKIDAKKKDVADDQQAIADAESDLQKAGGDPGWAR